jgi:hypoxanthine phosphoribosyltransferase
MKPIRLILSFIAALLLAGGGYFYYNYQYVETLRLSEIVGNSGNLLENMLTNIFDFDTGLTRHDMRQIEKRKDYWLQRMNDLQQISVPDQQAEEMARLYNEMSEDESMAKLRDKVFEKNWEVGMLVLEVLK